MANKSDNFWGGFFVGTVLGALVGAVVVAKVSNNAKEETPEELDNRDIALSLEEKIAQLNAAIDAVSKELEISNSPRSA